MSAPPLVPHRPARSQDSGAHLAPAELPQVPPRPARQLDPSQSRDRANFAPSPLNDSPFANNIPSIPARPHQADFDSNSLNGLARKPSIQYLPQVGQEGDEYASLDEPVDNIAELDLPTAHATQTRNVAGDLPLHAPKASLNSVAARSKIAPVTRTDSSGAASMGLGRPQTEYDDADHSLSRVTSRQAQFRAPSTDGLHRTISRPGSTHPLEHVHGIPQIGFHVPMYPNAGDVQAPSPAPIVSAHSTGVGFFNDAASRGTPSTDGRRRSSHGFHIPPGSYGLHGHGHLPQDQFERDWYKRHPEEAQKEEHDAHGPGNPVPRPEWTLSSDDLNKIVRETGSRGLGFGTHPGMIGTPSEQIGYMASEEYAARISSPLAKSMSRTVSGHSASAKPSFPAHEMNAAVVDSEAGEDKVHVNPPAHPGNKITGGGYDPPTEDLGPRGGNTEELGGWIHERGFGTPILASDELAKDPNAEYMHPAISPEQEKRGDTYYAGMDSEHPGPYQSGYRNRSKSRPSNRIGLSRFTSYDAHEGVGTPLEEIEEYEPLFKEDEKEEPRRPQNAADRLKHPELDRHRFPSQDIWEDTPDSLRLETTVTHEQEPDERSPAITKMTAASLFESPDKELARKGEILESERLDFLSDANKGLAKPKFKPHVMHETTPGRPGMRQRFPSRDIWEDNPDSLQLTTEVDEPQAEATTSPIFTKSPIEQRFPGAGMLSVDAALKAPAAQPETPSRPKAKAEDVPESGPDSQLAVPARPRQQVPPSYANDAVPSAEFAAGERKVPSIPDRPKPSVPARPARQSQDTSTGGLSDTIAGGNDDSLAALDRQTSPPLAKSNPAAPPRPAQSSKFASLKAGFMTDLNSRLSLGPQAPPKPAPSVDNDVAEEERAPLADARKARARGPQRRTPAAAAANASPADATAPTRHAWTVSNPSTIFALAPTGSTAVALGTAHAHTLPTAASLHEHPTASPLARNTAGEALLPTPTAPQTARGALAHAPDAAMDARARRESAEQRARMAPYVEATIGAPGDVPAAAEHASVTYPVSAVSASEPGAQRAEAAARETATTGVGVAQLDGSGSAKTGSGAGNVGEGEGERAAGLRSAQRETPVGAAAAEAVAVDMPGGFVE